MQVFSSQSILQPQQHAAVSTRFYAKEAATKGLKGDGESANEYNLF